MVTNKHEIEEKLVESCLKTRVQSQKAERPASTRPVRSNYWRQRVASLEQNTGNIHGALVDTASEVGYLAKREERLMISWSYVATEEASGKEEKMTT